MQKDPSLRFGGSRSREASGTLTHHDWPAGLNLDACPHDWVGLEEHCLRGLRCCQELGEHRVLINYYDVCFQTYTGAHMEATAVGAHFFIGLGSDTPQISARIDTVLVFASRKQLLLLFFS